MQIDSLYQQRPVFLGGRWQCRKRSVLHLPLAAEIGDQPRFNILARCQPEQEFRCQRRLHVGHGTTNQQGFFLPVFAKELVWREAAKYAGIFHAAIISMA